MIILIILLIILLLISIGGLIRYTSKKNEDKIDVEYKKLSDDARLHYSVELLNFIDTLIEVEINNSLKTELIVGKKVDIRCSDDAVRSIAQTVFDAVDKKVYSSEGESILNPKYIMTYITRRTLLMYITYATEHNKSIVA